MIQLIHTPTDMLHNRLLKRGIYKELINGKTKMAVVGLNNTGWRIAQKFAEDFQLIAFDPNQERIELMKHDIDPFNLGRLEKHNNIELSNSYIELKKARLYIISANSIVDDYFKPNLQALTKVTHCVAKVLKRRDYVVFETSAYPGCIDEVCIPILEEISGLKVNEHFKVGFAPENLSGNFQHKKLASVKKLISSSDSSSMEQICQLYNHIIKTGVHKAPTIRLTEILKMIDKTQCRLNQSRCNYA